MSKKILIVDDMMVNREILKQIFSDTEYDILTATNGKEAYDLVEKYASEIVIVLLDIIMPVMNGFEFLDKFNVEYGKHIPVIMITGDDSSESEVRGLDAGVADFVKKPFENAIIRKRVRNTIKLFEYRNHLEEVIQKKTKEVEDKNQELLDQNNFLIEQLATVVEFRDANSGEHIKNVKGITRSLIMELKINNPEKKLTDEMITNMSNASVLHDVGKITISDTILLKPGKLTKEEFEIMKTHTTKGCDILKSFEFTDNDDFYNYCYEICRHHHERYDGRGYPDGLKGDDIPLSAQIVSIADVFDALISPRVYKPAYTPDVAYQMIKNGECGVFNPLVMDVFNSSREVLCDMAKVRKTSVKAAN